MQRRRPRQRERERTAAWALCVPFFCCINPAHANTRIIAQTRPLYTTTDDPSLYITTPGGDYDGVTRLLLNRSDGTFICSGVLLNNGRDILTAAHCLTDDNGNLITNSVNALFQLPTGSVSLAATQINVHPDWDGDFGIGNDLALISLDQFAPAEIPRHGIYIDTDEVGRVVDKAGYGRSGQGNDGDILGSGTKRAGQNVYDALGDVLDPVGGLSPLPGAQLAYDFDDGNSAHDAFGFFDSALGTSGLDGLGLGSDEVMSAPGDSGGPTFIDNLVAGITSYGLRLNLVGNQSSDVDASLNSSFGEFAVDTRVSYFADWITNNLSQPMLEMVIGDLNGDGFVGVQDIDLVLTNWNQSVPAGSLLAGDPNGDGFVGVDDLNLVLVNWNNGVPPTRAATIPEPASLAWLCLGSLVWMRRNLSGRRTAAGSSCGTHRS